MFVAAKRPWQVVWAVKIGGDFMGFKEWLAKPRLSDEEWRTQAAFAGKAAGGVLAALWLVSAGTEYVDRQTKILGATGMPIADTAWNETLELSSSREGYCYISGQYRVINTGDLAFKIKKVILEVYHFDPKGLPAKLGEKEFDASISAMSNTFAQQKPIVGAEITVDEVFSKKNRMYTSFDLEFAIPETATSNDLFVITARGTGGLPNTDGWLLSALKWSGIAGSEFAKFGVNDLRITSETFGVGKSHCTELAKPETEENASQPKQMKEPIAEPQTENGLRQIVAIGYPEPTPVID